MKKNIHLYEAMIYLKKNKNFSVFFYDGKGPYLGKKNSDIRVIFSVEENNIKLKSRTKSICITAREDLESRLRFIKVSVNEDSLTHFLKRLFVNVRKNDLINNVYNKIWNDYCTGKLKYSPHKNYWPDKPPWIQYEFKVKFFSDYFELVKCSLFKD